MKPTSRLKSVDGLRGIAILAVVGFHYFYAFSPRRHEGDLLPFGNAFERFWPFRLGHTGVLLFFIVSGFVIAMTLERCTTPREFLIRRVARLWPPVVAWSFAIFGLLMFSQSPFAQLRRPLWQDLLPSLTLTPLELWRPLFPRVQWMDFAFWTLVVEIRFYFIAAALYWLLRRVRVELSLTVLAVSNFAAAALVRNLLPEWGEAYTNASIADHLPWFAAGAVFYELFRERLTKRQALAMLLPLFLIVVKIGWREVDKSSAIGVVALSGAYFVAFWLVAVKSRTADVFSAKWLTNVGLWSYSIYLLHDPVGLILISHLPHALPLWMSTGVVALIVVFVVALGFVSYRLIELPGQKMFASAIAQSTRDSARSERYHASTADAA